MLSSATKLTLFPLGRQLFKRALMLRNKGRPCFLLFMGFLKSTGEVAPDALFILFMTPFENSVLSCVLLLSCPTEFD